MQWKTEERKRSYIYTDMWVLVFCEMAPWETKVMNISAKRRAVHTLDESSHVDMDNTPGSPYPPGNVSPIPAALLSRWFSFPMVRYVIVPWKVLFIPKTQGSGKRSPETNHSYSKASYRRKSIPEYLMAFIGFHISTYQHLPRGPWRNPKGWWMGTPCNGSISQGPGTRWWNQISEQ